MIHFWELGVPRTPIEIALLVALDDATRDERLDVVTSTVMMLAAADAQSRFASADFERSPITNLTSGDVAQTVVSEPVLGALITRVVRARYNSSAYRLVVSSEASPVLTWCEVTFPTVATYDRVHEWMSLFYDARCENAN